MGARPTGKLSASTHLASILGLRYMRVTRLLFSQPSSLFFLFMMITATIRLVWKEISFSVALKWIFIFFFVGTKSKILRMNEL